MDIILTFFLVCNAVIAIAIILAIRTFDNSIISEGKKTRKETQEIKTRLSQVRKDLNTIELKVDLVKPAGYNFTKHTKKNGK